MLRLDVLTVGGKFRIEGIEGCELRLRLAKLMSNLERTVEAEKVMSRGCGAQV